MTSFISSNADFFDVLKASLIAADDDMSAAAQLAVSARLDIDTYQIEHYKKCNEWYGISECFYKVLRTRTDKWLRVLLDTISNANDCINSSETIYDNTGHKTGIKYVFTGLSEDAILCLVLLEHVITVADQAYEIATKSQTYTKIKARNVWRADFADAFLDCYKTLMAEQVDSSRESHKVVFYDKCRTVDKLMFSS